MDGASVGFEEMVGSGALEGIAEVGKGVGNGVGPPLIPLGTKGAGILSLRVEKIIANTIVKSSKVKPTKKRFREKIELLSLSFSPTTCSLSAAFDGESS